MATPSPTPPKVGGYAKLSSLMSTDPEFAIYRKFGALNAQNLLYYQAELMGLEDDLQEIAARDRASEDIEKQDFEGNWYELSHASPGKDLQLKKFIKIRRVLKEYNDCLIQQVKIAKIEHPSTYNLKMLRRWLQNKTLGKRFLVGLEEKTWDESYNHDLLAIPRPDGEIERDRLSKIFLGRMIELYHVTIGRFYKTGTSRDADDTHLIVRYKDSKILRVADVLSTLLSSALPVASIIALNYISSMIIRLLAIALFTMSFSLILSLMTSARRIEIFAATAAFVAVQVVFVGSTNRA